MNLNQLQPGQKATIIALKETPLSARLLDMGIYPGLELQLVRLAPFGDPMQVELGGCSLSLRCNEAEAVEVQLLSEGEAEQ